MQLLSVFLSGHDNPPEGEPDKIVTFKFLRFGDKSMDTKAVARSTKPRTSVVNLKEVLAYNACLGFCVSFI